MEFLGFIEILLHGTVQGGVGCGLGVGGANPIVKKLWKKNCRTIVGKLRKVVIP